MTRPTIEVHQTDGRDVLIAVPHEWADEIAHLTVLRLALDTAGYYPVKTKHHGSIAAFGQVKERRDESIKETRICFNMLHHDAQ